VPREAMERRSLRSRPGPPPARRASASRCGGRRRSGRGRLRQSGGGGRPIKPPEAVKPPEPIKPQAPTLSPAEIHQKVAAFAADGKHLAAQGKWREARAKLSAALALDPANIPVKDVLDMVQTKIDEDQHLQDDFDSVKRAFADKDYENALRKLYRLPRDKGWETSIAISATPGSTGRSSA